MFGNGLNRDISQRSIPLFLRIHAGHPKAHFFAFYLEYLALHFPEKRLVPALSWLIKNQLVGPKFKEFVEDQCASSALELVRELTKRVDRDRHLRALTAADIRA